MSPSPVLGVGEALSTAQGLEGATGSLEAVGGASPSISETISTITKHGKSEFNEVQGRAKSLLDDSGNTDTAFRSAISRDPGLATAERVQSTFQGLQDVATQGAKNLVGDMGAALPGAGNQVASTFSSIFGKVSSTLTSLGGAQEASKVVKDSGFLG